MNLKSAVTSALNTAKHNYEHRIDDRMFDALLETREAIDAIRCSGIVNADLERTVASVETSMQDITNQVSPEKTILSFVHLTPLSCSILRA